MVIQLLSEPGGKAVQTVEPGRVFCIGMNYVEHIEELNSKRPSSPVVFMKPRESLASPGETIPFPPHGSDLHFETEFVVMISKEGRPANESEALSMIGGVGLGFDLTLRDVQNRLKSAGHPWEASKAFEKSAPLSDLIVPGPGFDFSSVEFSGVISGQVRQQGNTKDMIFHTGFLISHIGSIWNLKPGDLIFTGTPPGVGSLNRGDRLEAISPVLGHATWQMEEN